MGHGPGGGDLLVGVGDGRGLGGPMKIGRVRRAPSTSWSSTTGLLVGNSTRTAAKRISTMGQTLPCVARCQVAVASSGRACVEPIDVGPGIFPECAEVTYGDQVEVAVVPGVVEPVSEDELVSHPEAREA